MNKFKTAGFLGTILFGMAVVAAEAVAEPIEIVALGDSLVAGYGLASGESFPEQLEAALQERGHDVTVVNAGVSGDTASDGLARLEWSVPASADVVIVEFGGNDAMRGIDPGVTRAAVTEIVATLKGRGHAVLLAGMQAPRNFGDTYTREFDSIFPDVAAEYDVSLYPFFLEGIALDSAYNLPDGIHPSAGGVAAIVESILPAVEELIAEVGAGD
jgi:acyl-CoA thioesterase-1